MITWPKTSADHVAEQRGQVVGTGDQVGRYLQLMTASKTAPWPSQPGLASIAVVSRLPEEVQVRIWDLVHEIAVLMQPVADDRLGTVRTRTDWLRRKHGLKVRQIALLLGVSQVTLSVWRAGQRSPSAQHQVALTELEQLDSTELLARLRAVQRRKAKVTLRSDP